jgi:hypothetical protein
MGAPFLAFISRFRVGDVRSSQFETPGVVAIYLILLKLLSRINVSPVIAGRTSMFVGELSASERPSIVMIK